MSLSQLGDILQSETHVPIPLLEQRLESLHEAATVLKDVSCMRMCIVREKEEGKCGRKNRSRVGEGMQL